MAVTICDFLGCLDAVIPFCLAESWDNCGLQAGRSEALVTKVLVALDVTMEVMAGALAWGADLVLTHHPFDDSPPEATGFQCHARLCHCPVRCSQYFHHLFTYQPG